MKSPVFFVTNRPSLKTRFFPKTLGALACVVVVIGVSQDSRGEYDANLPDSDAEWSVFEAFTEPHKTIRVAAPESGIVKELLVEIGQPVEAGEPLARLDTELHEALLAIAEAGKDARGRLTASEAEVRLRQQRAAAIESVWAKGHASHDEMERARADLTIAQGQLAQAEENLRLKELEHKRILVQIERRTIRAPIRGVVTDVYKQVGEFTAPNDPVLFTVVQLDPLVANFNVLGAEAALFEEGQRLQVSVTETGEQHQGVVEFVSPVLDAESGTATVKVRIPNLDGRLRSGQACRLATP
ncbi:MAG: efflux RND transporter periplasmic adaptor subunit [Planctomycetota bacterium]